MTEQAEDDVAAASQLVEPEVDETTKLREERKNLQAWIADLQQRQNQLGQVQARGAWIDGWMAARGEDG